MPVLRYFDVVVIVVAAPIMLLIGVPARGYLVAGGAWIVFRAVGVGVERAANAVDFNQGIGIRLSYMMGRLFALAFAVILVRQWAGKDAGLTALLLIVFAFTIQLGISAATRPRSEARKRPTSR